MELKLNQLENLCKQDIICFQEHFIPIIIIFTYFITIIIYFITIITYFTSIIIYFTFLINFITISNKLFFTIFNKQDHSNFFNL